MRFKLPGTQAGFTLVEVMVAMMIVALALPALLDQAERLSQHTFVARAKTQAYWVAQNKMAEININRRLNGELPPRKESDTVELGRDKWRWTVTTEERPLPLPGASLLHVEVVVGRAGEEGGLAWLSGFMPSE